MQKSKFLFYGLCISGSLFSSVVFGAEQPTQPDNLPIGLLCADINGIYVSLQGKPYRLDSSEAIKVVSFLEKHQDNVGYYVRSQIMTKNGSIEMYIGYPSPKIKATVQRVYQELLIANHSESKG